MVIQKNWNEQRSNAESGCNSDNSSSTVLFQAPQKPVSPPVTANMQTKQTITRQIAINTLAAMHRRFSLPGPVQPHSRPIAEFRASANKSLDMLRQTIQSAVTKEIDQVIKKYLEKFFVPAVNNIRLNLGEESVGEDQVRAICRAMLDATRMLYVTPPKTLQTPQENDADSLMTDAKGSKLHISFTTKRKEFETECDVSLKKKKKDESLDSSSGSILSQMVFRDPEKWNPARLTQDTLFIMGSHAHKVLGLGNARGRLYTRHADLLKYPADSVDKEWIASHNLVNAVGGKTYIMVLEDIEELAASDAYRHNSLPMLGELTGFKVPPFMLKKIKAYIAKRVASNDISNPNSPQPSTSGGQTTNVNNVKVTDEQNTIDFNNFDPKQYMVEGGDQHFSEDGDLQMMKENTDFDDIKVEDIDDLKVDGIKVEDLDEIKVEGIKVEDLDVDQIKVESIDDIKDVMKLKNDDEFDLCKQAEDEQSHLVDGLLEADIEFLSKNLGNIESDADARKTIEKLTGANPDTITLVGDEFDLASTLNPNNFTVNQTKCITVASTTSGMVHSVPVAHLAGGTVHYYSGSLPPLPRLPRATVTIQSIPGTTSQMIRGIPINTKTGTFSTVMSQGTANTIIGFGTRTSTGTIIGTPAQYVTVASKSFPTGNILHNAIVSRNVINRTNLTAVSTGVTYNVTAVRPIIHTTATKTAQSDTVTDFDNISTTKDMIDNACNSSVMLKKVLTLGSSGSAKSFIMHNTQKVLSTGFANGASPPPNVTIVSSGVSPILNNRSPNVASPNAGLSATHATLSALLASSAENGNGSKN